LVLFFGIFAFTGAPYVPSHKREIELLFENLYPLSSKEHVIDLGSGDGIVLKIAAEHGAKATGIELNPALAAFSRLRLKSYKKVSVLCRNLYNFHFPKDTTLVYLFGLDRDFARIEAKIQNEANRLNKSLYFVSYGFQSESMKPEKTYRAYFLYKITPKII
jgi:SAM-dependent methyltransferase